VTRGYIGVGEAKVFELGVQTPSAQDGNDSPVSRNVLDIWARTPGGKEYVETNGDDNRRIFMLTRA
jgi:hypothetical protein